MRFVRDVGLVLAAFILLLALENLAIGLGYRAEFVGTWEMGSARLYLSPIALATLVPVAAVLVLLAQARREVAVAAGALGGAAVALGVSTGRHLASPAVRVPFVVVVAAAFGAALYVAAGWWPRAGRRSLAGLGAAAAAAGWLADAFVLPRLYPAFHLALLALTIAGWAATALVVRRTRAEGPVSAIGLLVGALALAWTPHAAAKAGAADNLRRVLLEHAPVLGRAVVVASRISPPPPIEEDESASATLTSLRAQPGERALDWRGRDIVLVTIDALRADHVSAYGYARPTTPSIDALAARGVRFDHAYCPTPHTSYSIASMMTGKYMKPLLALGADDSSETWPVQLRRYGYRTAAFYPPAVFFIDEHRFRRMRDENLGFEYYKEEYARPELRKEQIERYVTSAPRDKPLFLWVHLFEPHEPYEMHADHPFAGDPRLDAYDSEVAAADELVGQIVKLVGETRPPGGVFIVSADHGEEHGDHGGRYHGTTVYEEQVRVPLVVVARGLSPHVVTTPVQTIDLLPTSLAALDVPRPPRLRGRDLGALLVKGDRKDDEGLAFAETDDYTLVARGSERLVCARKIGSCTLFDLATDPTETRPVVDRPARVLELRKLGAAIERETGKVEVGGLPDALRRGLLGDRDAAEDVAPLLDDARVDIRRMAARCAFRLNAPSIQAQLERSAAKDDDVEVRTWSTLALARLPEHTAKEASSILESGTPEQRTAAALALAEHGDGGGEGALVARWTAAFTPPATGEIDEARELTAAFAKIHAKTAVPALVGALEDVRLRPHVVEALAEIGDPRGKDPLLRVFEGERYLHLRPIEARALVRLGAKKEELLPPLMRFAGTPEPMVEALEIAREAKLLTPDQGGAEWATPPSRVQLRPGGRALRLTKAGPARLLVLAERGDHAMRGTINGMNLPDVAPFAGNLYVIELGELPAGDVSVGISPATVAAWLVPRAAEIPPPPAVAWAFDAAAP